LGAVYFAFQIYCDFSGYSDIAIGISKLFGFELMSNFKFPYFSRNIGEFWRRWHISLSTWFKDYLYIPLGGSKEGKWKSFKNIFIVFIVSGFWHGANWTFIFWGLFHSVLFLPSFIFKTNRKYSTSIIAENTILPTPKEFIQIGTTFALVTIGWVIFRSQTLEDSLQYLLNINPFDKSHHQNPYNYILSYKYYTYIIILLVSEYVEIKVKNANTFYNLLLILILSLVILFCIPINSSGEFIYFQF
jgi:D-alanyl-lipoteichoic acid acyltransferase DltB (MBOAT superfamily)